MYVNTTSLLEYNKLFCLYNNNSGFCNFTRVPHPTGMYRIVYGHFYVISVWLHAMYVRNLEPLSLDYLEFNTLNTFMNET